MLVIGIDLAWGEGDEIKSPKETGIVAVDASGTVTEAGWCRGLSEAVAQLERCATEDTLITIDAPLVVNNASGQRLCETQVGQRYGRWKVAANSTNLAKTSLAGVSLLKALTDASWHYHDGKSGPPAGGKHVAEVYPYTTIVGVEELGYDVERPLYKRKPRHLSAEAFRPIRAAACDELLTRVARLVDADPPLDLRSHAITARLVDEPSPLADLSYKHREDLLDAALCAWTGLLWLRYGFARCQVLGADDLSEPTPTIIAPYRPGTVQRAGRTATKRLRAGRSPGDHDGGLPALAAEDYVCPTCGISYHTTAVDDALDAIASLPARLRVSVEALPDVTLRTRPHENTWSPLEYLCHLRDVLVSATIRLYRTRTEDTPAIEPMFNDLRAARFNYNHRNIQAVLNEMADNAKGFLDEAHRMSGHGWDRRLRRLPGETRTARWLVRQTMHEGEHHLHDILAAASDQE
jgi:predicted RNase H-like nuclease